MIPWMIQGEWCPVRVAFMGNFRVPHTSENDYLWTMRERLGFDVTPLQESTTPWETLRKTAIESDLFLWVHTHGWDMLDYPMTQVLADLRALGVPSVAYHLDLFQRIDRWGVYEAHPYFQMDHFFTVDKVMADWLNENTPTKGYFLRPGVVERDCFIDERPKTRDIVFVGSYKYHHEWPYRKQLIDWLQETYRGRFQLWGPHGHGLVRGTELNKLYGETKVVIGDTLCPGFDYPYYTSNRAYEVLGHGGFLIHPRITGMEEELIDGRDLVYYDYNDFDGLKRKIDYYLEHDDERDAIMRCGNATVTASYTYTHRLGELFSTLKGIV